MQRAKLFQEGVASEQPAVMPQSSSGGTKAGFWCMGARCMDCLCQDFKFELFGELSI